MSETTLGEMISEGRFPDGIPWTGKEKRWPWQDFVWWDHHLKVLSRLAGPDDSKPKPPRNRPESPG